MYHAQDRVGSNIKSAGLEAHTIPAQSSTSRIPQQLQAALTANQKKAKRRTERKGKWKLSFVQETQAHCSQAPYVCHNKEQLPINPLPIWNEQAPKSDTVACCYPQNHISRGCSARALQNNSTSCGEKQVLLCSHTKACKRASAPSCI